MVRDGDRRQLDAVDELEYVHANQHLRCHNEHIAHRDDGAMRERCVKRRSPKRDTDERVCCQNQDDNLRCCRYVVIDEATSIHLIEVCVGMPIEPFYEKVLEDVEADHK